MRKIRFAQEQIIETLNEPQGGALPDVLAKHAFFFDLGETLYTYADVPLSWSEHYRPALVGAALECGVRITNEKLDAAIVELSKFDTRKYPRLVEHPADFIFRQVIFALGLTVDYLETLIAGFFRYFRQRLRVYPDAFILLTYLSSRSIYTGALTDVPYGMPRTFVLDDLNEARLQNLILEVLTSVDVGYRKPGPEGFLELSQGACTLPELCYYIGNEEKDIKGALNAGLMPVLIWRQDCPAPSWGQAVTVSSLDRLISFIEGR